MKVSKEQSQLNRQALLDAAGLLFKQHGIDGVGVADVCREAGLTQGALYKHFNDKQDLAAQAFAHAFRAGYDKVSKVGNGKTRTLATYLNPYLSISVRDDLSKGCPLIATACETARQGEAVSRSFSDAFLELRSGIEETMAEGCESNKRRAVSTTIVAALMGAMAISRGLLQVDREEADRVLREVRDVLESLARSTTQR